MAIRKREDGSYSEPGRHGSVSPADLATIHRRIPPKDPPTNWPLMLLCHKLFFATTWDTSLGYLINQTLRGSLVCTDGLLLINQRKFPRSVWEFTVVALVVTRCFKNWFLSFSISYIPTTIVIIYMFNVIDSLSILGYIYYSPISIILRVEIQRYKTWV